MNEKIREILEKRPYLVYNGLDLKQARLDINELYVGLTREKGTENKRKILRMVYRIQKEIKKYNEGCQGRLKI